MQIYVVYDAHRLSKNIEVYEFFDCVKDANNYIKEQDYQKYLSVYTPKNSLKLFNLSDFLNKDLNLGIPDDINFIKGFHKEILCVDETLIVYFSNILEFYLSLNIQNSLEIQFQIQLLTSAVNELKLRLENLEKTKLYGVGEGDNAFL